MRDLDLVSIGSWTIFDYILRADHYPEEGETVALDMPSKLIHTRFFGDCSANLAAAAASMGVKVGLGMVVGDDFNTSGYRAHMLELGVDLSGVDVRAGEDSGYSYNVSDRRGRSVCYSHLGLAADQSGWEPPYEQIERARAVAISEKFCSYTLRSVQRAKEVGATTVINGMVATANENARDFLAAADHLFISRRELEALLHLLDMTAPRDLLSVGPAMIVVTHGAEGSRWILADGEFFCDAVPAAELQDATGAGDVFAGAATAMMLRGAPPQQAAQFAATLASFVVEKWGCQTNLVGTARVEQRMSTFFDREVAE
ncbi:MAG: carbohydrate kinase family protein [Hyphomicrobiales bacterium]|nr:carbohydrate kinase family protein [Hyphomicrobiales bacterium]